MLTICDPMDQARILDWVAFPFSWGSSQCRDRTQVSHTAGYCLNRQGSAHLNNLTILYNFFLKENVHIVQVHLGA